MATSRLSERIFRVTFEAICSPALWAIKKPFPQKIIFTLIIGVLYGIPVFVTGIIITVIVYVVEQILLALFII